MLVRAEIVILLAVTVLDGIECRFLRPSVLDSMFTHDPGVILLSHSPGTVSRHIRIGDPVARRPTVYDVAELAGVSIATVSFAFSKPDRVKSQTLEAVLAA